MKRLTSAAGQAKHASEIAATLACARLSRDEWAKIAICNGGADKTVRLVRTVTGVLQHHDSITGTPVNLY